MGVGGCVGVGACGCVLLLTCLSCRVWSFVCFVLLLLLVLITVRSFPCL